MCKPCSTAAECQTTEPTEPARRRRARKPNRLEELKRIATAALQALGAFDFTMSELDWYEARDGTAEADSLVAGFRAAGQMIASASELLGRHYPKCYWDDALAPNTYGSYLRYAARLMDELDRDTGLVGGHTDENEHAYHLLEMCPHLLADRSARDPSSCPLCGSAREKFDGRDDDGSRMLSWCCWTCHGDVKKAKKVLKSRRVDKSTPLWRKANKARKQKAAPAPAPATLFGLPWFGELDCRTDAEKAADEAVGVPPPVAFIPAPPKRKAKSKPKAEPKPAPALHNRIAGIV